MTYERRLQKVDTKPLALVTNAKVAQLEEVIKENLDLLDVEALTEHHFAPGIYTRKLFIPAGAMLTGKIHRYEVQNILVSGTIRVTTDEGVKELTGPMIFNSAAGTKKAGYAVTDVIWLNVHPTESTDLEEIESHFIVPSLEALEQEQKLCLGEW